MIIKYSYEMAEKTPGARETFTTMYKNNMNNKW